MHPGIACVLAASIAQAGTIQGIVVEHASGRPLSRTTVELRGVNSDSSYSLITDRVGHFAFPGVREGLYTVVAKRQGFFDATYGQRKPVGRGTPVEVTKDSDLFAELRMRRKGAITGRVLDENGVGLPGVQVLAYLTRSPLRPAGRGTSDDRGVYRIAGLDPGKYWIRTAAATLEDGSGILPTFGPLAREIRDARVHRVVPDADTTDANVQPEAGMLFSLTGVVTCINSSVANVTISSETLRKEFQASCGVPYKVEGLAPAVYELFAAGQGETEFGFVEMQLTQSSSLGNIQMMPPPKLEVEIRNAQTNMPLKVPFMLTGMRDPLSGPDNMMRIWSPSRTFAPGFWNWFAHLTNPAPGQYVESIIINLRREQPRAWRADRPASAHSLFLDQRGVTTFQVRISDKGGQVQGSVASAGGPAPFVPVFLLPLAPDVSRSIGGTRDDTTDANGRFRFPNLPPGDYRIFASLDFTNPSLDDFEEASARAVGVQPGKITELALDLWIAP